VLSSRTWKRFRVKVTKIKSEMYGGWKMTVIGNGHVGIWARHARHVTTSRHSKWNLGFTAHWVFMHRDILRYRVLHRLCLHWLSVVLIWGNCETKKNIFQLIRFGWSDRLQNESYRVEIKRKSFPNDLLSGINTCQESWILSEICV